MKLTRVLVAVVAFGIGAAPAWGAPPFGFFGGKVGGGNGAAGMLPLHGWALDDDGVEAVDILVDGVVAGRAHLKRGRPGVTARFPGFPDSAAPGFAFQVDTTRYLNGLHRVTARVISRTGELVTLNSRVFEFLNSEPELDPFGRIEFPNGHAELYGDCNGDGPRPRVSVVSGYALDVGLLPEDTGVGYVELMIDRALFANSKTDCHFDAAQGGLSDCYGLRRDDIRRIFPKVSTALHSGFRFVVDVGLLIREGFYTPGKHFFTVRAGDHADNTENIAEIPVIFACEEHVADELSIGFADFPQILNIFGGTMTFRGWALDFQGVQDVLIYVDGRWSARPSTVGPLPASRSSSRATPTAPRLDGACRSTLACSPTASTSSRSKWWTPSGAERSWPSAASWCSTRWVRRPATRGRRRDEGLPRGRPSLFSVDRGALGLRLLELEPLRQQLGGAPELAERGLDLGVAAGQHLMARLQAEGAVEDLGPQLALRELARRRVGEGGGVVGGRAELLLGQPAAKLLEHLRSRPPVAGWAPAGGSAARPRNRRRRCAPAGTGRRARARGAAPGRRG